MPRITEPNGTLPDWLPALLQLASPALPTGAFSYSQGLESACELGLVRDEAGALRWIDAQWRNAFHPRELPALDAAWQAVRDADAARLAVIDAEFVASRDSAEARAETLQVGAALLRWLHTLLPECGEAALARASRQRLCAPVAFALCARAGPARAGGDLRIRVLVAREPGAGRRQADPAGAERGPAAPDRAAPAAGGPAAAAALELRSAGRDRGDASRTPVHEAVPLVNRTSTRIDHR